MESPLPSTSVLLGPASHGVSREAMIPNALPLLPLVELLEFLFSDSQVVHNAIVRDLVHRHADGRVALPQVMQAFPSVGAMVTKLRHALCPSRHVGGEASDADAGNLRLLARTVCACTCLALTRDTGEPVPGPVPDAVALGCDVATLCVKRRRPPPPADTTAERSVYVDGPLVHAPAPGRQAARQRHGGGGAKGGTRSSHTSLCDVRARLAARFAAYGTVTYVSLPRHAAPADSPSVLVGRAKGWAFVEFDCAEAAAAAVKHVAGTKPGDVHHVLLKAEWLATRRRYQEAQREARAARSTPATGVAQPTPPGVAFTPGVVVHVRRLAPATSVAQLRAYMRLGGTPVYVDKGAGATEAWVRMAHAREAEYAVQHLEAPLRGHKLELTVLHAETEQAYWRKVDTDRAAARRAWQERRRLAASEAADAHADSPAASRRKKRRTVAKLSPRLRRGAISVEHVAREAGDVGADGGDHVGNRQASGSDADVGACDDGADDATGHGGDDSPSKQRKRAKDAPVPLSATRGVTTRAQKERRARASPRGAKRNRVAGSGGEGDNGVNQGADAGGGDVADASGSDASPSSSGKKGKRSTKGNNDSPKTRPTRRKRTRRS